MASAAAHPAISVIKTIEEGSNVLETGEILTMESFSLEDSMSAVEIMDPRMDSGISVPRIREGPFDPHQSLLPEELCWILDKAMACEMTWHSGYTLSQTVYICRYVHCVSELGLRRSQSANPTEDDLRIYVLRAGIFGLLKSCDLCWRELSKGNLRDTEDWNSEKFDVSLLEGVQLVDVLELLEDAIVWLETCPSHPLGAWKNALLIRVRLRRALLNIFADMEDVESAIQQVLQIIPSINLGDRPMHNKDSKVLNVFDHSINQELHSFLPLPPIEPMSFDDACKFILGVAHCRRGLVSLQKSMSIMTWESTSRLCSYNGLNASLNNLPYIRSLAMSKLYSNNKVFGANSAAWAVDQLFYEFGNIQPGSLINAIESPAAAFDQRHAAVNVDLFEKDVSQLLIQYLGTFYYNRSRQRRQFANAIVAWQQLFNDSLKIVRTFGVRELFRLPILLQFHRASMAFEIIFSGFELSLYSPHEFAFAYWYLIGVLSVQKDAAEQLIQAIKRDPQSSNSNMSTSYMMRNASFAKALMPLCNAFARLSLHTATQHQVDPSRESTNRLRRFKWAFGSQYEAMEGHDPIVPDFDGFEMWREAALDEPLWISEVAQLLDTAGKHLKELQKLSSERTGAGLLDRHCDSYMKLVAGLQGIVEGWHAIVGNVNPGQLPTYHWPGGHLNWFPHPLLSQEDDAEVVKN